MRVELLLVRRLQDSKSFESGAAILVHHYPGVHLREGKLLGGSSASHKPVFRDQRAYAAIEEGDGDDEDAWHDDWQG